MAAVFLKLLNLSISASWLVLAVLVLRLISKRSPKWMNVLLWGIVALRLVLPVGRLSVIVLILPIRRLPVLRWELSAVLLILPVWILSRILRRDLSVILWILPVWILSVILRRDRLSVLWILICSLCFLVHIFIFR